MRARNQTLPAAAAVLFAAVACAPAQKQTTYVPAYFLTNVYLHDATTTPLHVRLTNAAADVSVAAVAGSNFTTAAAVSGSNYTATAAGNATNYTQAAATAASNHAAAATNYLATNSLPALAAAGSNYVATAAVAGSNYVAVAAVAGSNYVGGSFAALTGATFSGAVKGPTPVSTNDLVTRQFLQDSLDLLSSETFYGATQAHPQLSGFLVFSNVPPANWQQTYPALPALVTNTVGSRATTNTYTFLPAGQYVHTVYASRTAQDVTYFSRLCAVSSDGSVTNFLGADPSLVTVVGTVAQPYDSATTVRSNMTFAAPVYLAVIRYAYRPAGGSAPNLTIYGGVSSPTHLSCPTLSAPSGVGTVPAGVLVVTNEGAAGRVAVWSGGTASGVHTGAWTVAVTNALGSGDATASVSGGDVLVSVNVSPRISGISDRLVKTEQSLGELALAVEADAAWATQPYSQFLADYYTDTNWSDAAGSQGVAHNGSSYYWDLANLSIGEATVCRYTMDDSNATTTVTDSSGLGKNGTLNGGTNTAGISRAGKIKGALYARGSSDYVTISSCPDFGTADFGVSLWVYWTRTNSQETLFALNGHSTSRAGLYVNHLGNGNTLQVVSFDTAGSPAQYNYSTFAAPITLSNWTHYVFTRETNVFRLYTNGALYAATSMTHALRFETSTTYLFARASAPATEYCAAGIDDFRLLTNGINPTNVTLIYNAGVGTQDSTRYSAGTLKSRGFGTAYSNNTAAITLVLNRPTTPNVTNLSVQLSPDGGSTYSNVSISGSGAWPPDTNYYRYFGRVRFGVYGTSPVYRLTWSNGEPSKAKGAVLYVEDSLE